LNEPHKMAILETRHAVDVSTLQSWLSQPLRLSKTTHVCLSGKDINDDAAALLGALTLQCCKLQTLRLPGNRIGDQGASCLAESLKLLPSSLQVLDLADNCLSAVGGRRLAQTFFTSSSSPPGADGGRAFQFRLLDLSKNHLDDHGVAGVARHILAGQAQAGADAGNVLLRLREVGCSSQGLSDLLGCRLAGLDISQNALGLEGGKAILAARRRKRWRSLRIAQISDQQLLPTRSPHLSPLAASIAESLGNDLADFECGSNFIGEAACCQIAEALGKGSPTLRRLVLPGTGFGLRACGALGQGLWPGAGLCSLQTLDLTGNELVDVSVELLSNGISTCPSLQEVQLADNAIGSRGTNVLASAVHSQRHLATKTQRGVLLLGLSGNPVGNDGAKALAAAATASIQDPRSVALEMPWGLERLELARTKVGREGCDALSGAVAARAALAEEASRRLAAGILDQATLHERWGLRQPRGLTVVGLDDGNAHAAEMLRMAQCRLAASWPQKEDALVNQGLAFEWDLDWFQPCTEDWDVEEAAAGKEVGLEDLELEESYFGGPFDGSKAIQAPAAATRPLEEQVEQKVDETDEPAQEPKADLTQKRSPPAKGKGKITPAKGMGPAPPKGKGKGPQPKGKGKGKEAAERTEEAGKGPAPFGRRMHWVQPRYSQPDHETVFDSDAAVDLDTDALASLLTGANGKGPTRTRTSHQRKAEGIKVLDASRAQNIAIVLTKLSVSLEDLCGALRSLDFSIISQLALSDDVVELLTTILPTHEETQKLKVHEAEKEQLRDIEQKILPFCFLPRATARLRVLRLASSHIETAAMYIRRCQTLRQAAKEARRSTELRQVLAMILRIGNYINHGMKDSSGGARAFSIETLGAITSFRLGSLSTLQFICTTLRRADPCFVESLSASLKHIPAASKEKSSNLKSCIQAFFQEVEFADREVVQLPEDQTASEAMEQFLQDLHSEVADLESALAEAFTECADVQEYFCTSEERKKDSTPPYENFFVHLSDFLESFRKAWRETEPAKPTQSGRPAAQKQRRRKDSAETKTRLKSTSVCRRPLPQASPDQLPDSGQRAESATSTTEKHGAFWEVDLDVESLLSNIFAQGDDTPGQTASEPTANLPASTSAEAEAPGEKHCQLSATSGPERKHAVQIDVDDLIDSIFE